MASSLLTCHVKAHPHGPFFTRANADVSEAREENASCSWAFMLTLERHQPVTEGEARKHASSKSGFCSAGDECWSLVRSGAHHTHHATVFHCSIESDTPDASFEQVDNTIRRFSVTSFRRGIEGAHRRRKSNLAAGTRDGPAFLSAGSRAPTPSCAP